MSPLTAPPVDDAALAVLSDLNFAESTRDLSRRSGGAVFDEDGLLLWAGAHDLPVIVNGVMRTDPGCRRQTCSRRHAASSRRAAAASR